MCRLFGAVSGGPLAYDLLEGFADLAVTGNTASGRPDGRGHRDGWGLALFYGGKLELYERGPGSARGSPEYSRAARTIAGTGVDPREGDRLVVVGHVRRASDGLPVGAEWSHPFVETRGGRTWAFAHNGGIDHFPFHEDEGLIDSQQLLRKLLRNLDGPELGEIAPAVASMVDEVRREYSRYTALNFLLADGERLHAFREYTEHPDYYTLYYDDSREAVIVCSQPIRHMRGTPVSKGSLLSTGPGLGITLRQVV